MDKLQEYISKRIGNSFILWFKQSNRWIHFEEPAWFVNSLYQQGVDRQVISGKLSRKYKLPAQECHAFVNEICDGILKFSVPFVADGPDLDNSLDSKNYFFRPYSVRHYLIANKRIAINFESRRSEYYIHPPLANLENRNAEESDFQIDIFEYKTIPVFRETRNTVNFFACEDFMQLRNKLYIYLCNFLYHKTEKDWMSFIHASAVTDGKETILLSSSSGSGKSTMAAMLQTSGLRVVSDDFVPIDVKTKKAYPFPAGLSVKEGAFDLLNPHYRDLKNSKYNQYEYQHPSIRYIPLEISDSSYFRPKLVKNIVFIGYSPDKTCEFKQLSIDESLKLFHEQAWVTRTTEHARAFLNWFVKLRCFRLEYGNTEEGINKVMSLFESHIN